MQQAIEEAKKMRDELDRIQRKSYMEYRHLKIDAINELIERLEKLPQDDGWISIEDRLPEED